MSAWYMATHFWVSSEAVPLTLEAVFALSDVKVRLFLVELRWGTTDQQMCPDCGAIDRHHNIRIALRSPAQ